MVVDFLVHLTEREKNILKSCVYLPSILSSLKLHFWNNSCIWFRCYKPDNLATVSFGTHTFLLQITKYKFYGWIICHFMLIQVLFEVIGYMCTWLLWFLTFNNLSSSIPSLLIWDLLFHFHLHYLILFHLNPKFKWKLYRINKRNYI